MNISHKPFSILRKMAIFPKYISAPTFDPSMIRGYRINAVGNIHHRPDRRKIRQPSAFGELRNRKMMTFYQDIVRFINFLFFK